jgi:hypothetical protein
MSHLPPTSNSSGDTPLPLAEGFLTPEQRLTAVADIVTEISLRIIIKRHERTTQNSDPA